MIISPFSDNANGKQRVQSQPEGEGPTTWDVPERHPDHFPSPPLFLCLELRQPAVSHLPVWLEGKPGQKWLRRRVWEPGQCHPGPAEPASQQQGLQLRGLRRHSDDATGDCCEPAAWWVPLKWDTLKMETCARAGWRQEPGEGRGRRGPDPRSSVQGPCGRTEYLCYFF